MDRVYRESTNLRTVLTAILLGILGLGLLLISYKNWFIDIVNIILREFGSLLIASVAVAIIWDLFSRRSFFKELLATTKLADEIADTGLVGISPTWHGQINWDDLIGSTKSIKIFFIYGRTWRNTNREKLTEFANKINTKAIIVLPDYNDQSLISRLSREIGYEPQALVAQITEAENDFIEIFCSNKKRRNRNLEIWHSSVYPIYSYYCFEHIAIVTFYSLNRDKVEVPTFEISNGKSLFSFFEKDFYSLIRGDDPPSSRYFPQS